MSRLKVVSFDLDGTITEASFVDSVWLEGIPRLYSLKEKISFEDAARNVKHEYDKVGRERLEWYDLRYWTTKFGLTISPEELLGSYANKIRAFPEAEGVLKEIKDRGLRQIVVSNARREFVDLELERTNFKRYFDHVFSATSDFGLIKKSVDTFQKVCSICRVKPEEMVHVGDDLFFDFEVPKKLGMSTFFLDRTGERNQEMTIHDLQELKLKLASWK